MSGPRIDLSGAAAAADGAPPRFLDVRFDAARRPVRCSGCTVVAPLAPADRAPFAAVRAAAEAAGVAEFWAWLPPSSYHMTLFDLLLHDRRDPMLRPADLPADAPPEAADSFALGRMAGERAHAPPPWRMRVLGLEASARSAACVAAALEPRDAAENARMRAMRDRWADATGLRHRPGHDAYVFHVTLAYLVRWPEGPALAAAERALGEASEALVAETPELNLHAAEVCVFDDMTEFRPRFVLA